MGSMTPDTLTWYCIRRNGVARSSGWIPSVPLKDLRKRIRARPTDAIEVCIAERFDPVDTTQFSRVFCNRVRGILGMEATFQGEVVRFAPTRMIAANSSFQRALEGFLEKKGASLDEFLASGKLRSFTGQQFLIPGRKNAKPVALYRGSTLVEQATDGKPGPAAALANDIGQWFLRNMSNDGALPYKYWPSRGLGSAADNAIRRFLGTLAITRLGELNANQSLLDAAQRNLRFNLKRYFKDIGKGRGAIVENTGAKLGAAALAALAIMESPARAEFTQELAKLAAGIESMADDKNGFRTFFFPAERDGENWNFYSGEALLFWAAALHRGESFAPTLEQCLAAFKCCRKKHLQKRNPAFVPWHTQACTLLFAHSGRREFAKFVLEMNDWLLSMQQSDGLPPDLLGRFYNPGRPDFGPPHAASTGVYLEGLADAVALAQALGDNTRHDVYELAIQRGLRSLRQLQFRDQNDTFYISKKNRVLGALRTEAYDNPVRVDSAAHALLAAVKIQRPIKFDKLPDTGGITGALRRTMSRLKPAG